MKSLSMFAAAAVIALGSIVPTSNADARVLHRNRHVYGAYGAIPFVRVIPYLGVPYFGSRFYGGYYGDWGHSGPSDRFQFQGVYD